MHLALELDQSKQVSADPKRDLDLALTVLRKRIDEFGVDRAADPEGGRRPHRGGARRHHRSWPRQGHRAAERVPRVPHHRQDQRARQGAARHGPRAPRARRQGRHRARQAVRRRRSCWAATRPRRRRPEDATAAGKDTTAPIGVERRRILQASSSLPARRPAPPTPGEYLVPETGVPAGGQPAQPPGRGAAAPARPRCCAGRPRRPASGSQSYRLLYVLDDRPIVTGSNLVDAQAEHRPAHQRRRSSPSSSTAPAARKFGEETGRHVGDYMAILLDGRVQGRPPVIQSRIEPQRPDHAGQQDPPGGPGPGPDAQGRRAADSAQDRRGAAGRRQPRRRLDPRRHHGRRRRAPRSSS